MNSIQIAGHLGQDVELTNLQNDMKVAKFSVATNRRFKNKDGERATDWQQLTGIAALHGVKRPSLLIDTSIKVISLSYRDA